MSRLIRVELKKIFHKKSIYIIWALMVMFCFLNNILYKTDYDDNGNYKYLEQNNLEQEEERLQKELEEYDANNLNEISMYITIKTKLDIIKLKKTFSSNDWQYKKIDTYLYDILYRLNRYKYTEGTTQEYALANKEYQIILEKFNKGDWQYFLEIEKTKLQESITNITRQLELSTDKKEQYELKEQLNDQKFSLKILNYRNLNQIKEDNSYLNIALENYQDNYKVVEYYKTTNSKLSYQEKLKYQEALSNMMINQYIVEHKQNINQQNNLNYQLRTIVEDYEIFLVMLVLIISGTIICDEFKDGTIKLLLIKPYSRCKILLSKYFSVAIVAGISILSLIILQMLIGGFIFGLDSLKMPVIVYHFEKAKIIEYSIFQYMTIRILARLPFFLMLISVAMAIGVILSNNILAITIPLITYMFSPSLEVLAIEYNLTFMKYLANMNWNLQQFLFGKIGHISFITLSSSVTVLVTYFIGLWILTFTMFKKKNIKNI